MKEITKNTLVAYPTNLTGYIYLAEDEDGLFVDIDFDGWEGNADELKRYIQDLPIIEDFVENGVRREDIVELLYDKAWYVRSVNREINQQ